MLNKQFILVACTANLVYKEVLETENWQARHYRSRGGAWKCVLGAALILA